MSDTTIAYRIELKNKLCCYIQLLDALRTELLLRTGDALESGSTCPSGIRTKTVGTGVSDIANCLFEKLVNDPQMSLYGSDMNEVTTMGLPIEFFGIKEIQCNGDIIDQYNASFLVSNGTCAWSITELTNPDTILFVDPTGITNVRVSHGCCPILDYHTAVCKLMNHLTTIREQIIHSLDHNI